MKDLGCYSYIFKIILGTVSLPFWSFGVNFADDPLNQWQELKPELHLWWLSRRMMCTSTVRVVLLRCGS